MVAQNVRTDGPSTWPRNAVTHPEPDLSGGLCKNWNLDRCERERTLARSRGILLGRWPSMSQRPFLARPEASKCLLWMPIKNVKKRR